MVPGRWNLPSGALLAALALVPAAGITASAQPVQGRNGLPAVARHASDGDGEPADNVFLPAERTVLQRLDRARKLLDQARYGEAVRCLGAILDGSEDYFFQPDKDVPIHHSLKAEAQRLIGQMPRKGRELYQLQYGARAQQMLGDAVAAGDAGDLAEVSRRFFHTRAGYEATLLLGLDHLDHARPLAGALTLRRLQEATGETGQFEPTLSLALATCWLQVGAPEKARPVLLALKRQCDSGTVRIAGAELALFGEVSQAIPWLAGLIGPGHAVGPAEPDRWTMFRGNPSRNATAHGGALLPSVRWRIPATDDPLVEEILRHGQRTCLENAVPTLPALHPLAVDDVVLMRTSRHLLAVDFSTGKRLWEVPADTPVEAISRSVGTDPFGGRSSQLAIALGYRMWDDATYGTISSDGRCVFAVEDLGAVIGASVGQRVIINGRSRTVVRNAHNRLAAYDIHTGKLKWHLGGPADQFALRQAETFFLGAPLPLMGRLYALAEVNEEIRLLALDARTGDLLWSQQLAMAQQSVLMDPARRLAGASPSYCDGILICPTCSGAVVGVELATRSLLWGYCYARPETVNRYSGNVFQAGPYWVSQPAQRWTETAVTVAEGRVLVAPVDSDWLYCLNLIDGKLLWKYRRKDDLYVAGVYQDQVVLVGRGGVRALSLSQTVEQTETTTGIARRGTRATIVKEKVRITTPKPAWDGRTVAFPEGSLPSGRGFLSGGQYFVPLSSAEVLAIDLAAGEIAHVSKSRESSESDSVVPGNLVCYKGKILSQTIDGLQVFYQLASARREVKQRLAARADDPAALSLRGEILLDEGRLRESIASFRQAHQLDAKGRTRSLLRDALLEGLRSEFADHRRHAEEIESLLDDPQQWATYLRLMAAGLQRTGQYGAALDYYLKLVDLDEDHRDLERLGKSLSVRRDRWIQARLAELRRDAQQQGAAIDQAIEARLEAAVEAPNVAPLRRFLDYFGDHPTAAKARRELFLRLKRSDQFLEAEMVLWQQRRSPEGADSRAAVSANSERADSERVNSERANWERWDGPAVAELADLLRQSRQPEDAALCYRRLGREFSDVVCRDGKTGRELLDALPDDAAIRQVLRRDIQWPVGKVEVTTTSAKRQKSSTRGRYAIPYRGSPGPFFAEKTIRFDQNQRSIVGYDAFGKQLFSGMLVETPSREMLPFNQSLTHVHFSGHLLLLSMSHRIMVLDTLDRGNGGGPKLLWSHDLSDPAFEAINLRRLPAQAPNLAWGMPAFRPTRRRGRTSVLGPITSRYVAFQRYRNLIAADPLTGDVLWIRHGIAPQSVLFGDDEMIFAVAADQDEATVYRALDGELLGKRTIPQIEHARVLPDGARRPALASFGQTCIATLGRNVLTWQLDGGRQILEAYDPWEQRPLWPPRTFSADAKICLAGHEAIGVLQRDGHFVLLALPDGRTIADVRLEPDAYLSEIRLFRSGDQYVLATHSPRPLLPGGNPRTTQQIPGTLCMPISFGRVYTFDLEGNPMWARPVRIENQQLVLNQPARLPVLLLACQSYDRTQSGSARYQVSVVCIDKRTGRKVYRAKFPKMSSIFEAVGDPEKDTVALTLTQGSVALTFTGEPVDETSKTEGEEDLAPWRRKLPKTAGALLKALERAVIGHGARRSDMDNTLDNDSEDNSEDEEDPFGDEPADEPAIE